MRTHHKIDSDLLLWEIRSDHHWWCFVAIWLKLEAFSIEFLCFWEQNIKIAIKLMVQMDAEKNFKGNRGAKKLHRKNCDSLLIYPKLNNIFIFHRKTIFLPEMFQTEKKSRDFLLYSFLCARQFPSERSIWQKSNRFFLRSFALCHLIDQFAKMFIGWENGNYLHSMISISFKFDSIQSMSTGNSLIKTTRKRMYKACSNWIRAAKSRLYLCTKTVIGYVKIQSLKCLNANCFGARILL